MRDTPPGRTCPPDPERTPRSPAVWRGGGARAALRWGEGVAKERGGDPTAPQTAKS